MIASNYHNYLIVHRAKIVKSGKNQKALSRCTSVLEHLNSRTMKTGLRFDLNEDTPPVTLKFNFQIIFNFA